VTVRCGLTPADCIADHWCPVLDGRKERAGWRLQCPVCHTPRALSITVQGNRVLWNCHHQPACDRQTIRAELARLPPGCIGSGRKMHPATASAIEALAADKTLTPTALRVATLLELGWTAARIRAELKIPRQTWSDAVRILGHRLSGFSDTRAAQLRPNSRTAPQVTESQNAPLEQLDNMRYPGPAGRRRVRVSPLCAMHLAPAANIKH
jgi:hypothetical protein